MLNWGICTQFGSCLGSTEGFWVKRLAWLEPYFENIGLRVLAVWLETRNEDSCKSQGGTIMQVWTSVAEVVMETKINLRNFSETNNYFFLKEKDPLGLPASLLKDRWMRSSERVRSDQSLSRVRLFATPRIPACQASLSITNSRSSLRLTSIESVMPSSHSILCRPLLLLSPVPPSIRVFSNESTLCMRWPKYWSFSFSITHSKEIPGLISFRMDWLDLLAVQGTLKSLLQHHSSKASILWLSAFFTLSHTQFPDCICCPPYWPLPTPLPLLLLHDPCHSTQL